MILQIQALRSFAVSAVSALPPGAPEPSGALFLWIPLSQSIVPTLPDASVLPNDPKSSKKPFPSVPKVFQKIVSAGGPLPDGCPRAFGSSFSANPPVPVDCPYPSRCLCTAE